MLINDLGRQLNILVENQIHHIDLHPGNVLVDNQDNLYIIDFDKARTTPQNRQKLKKKYLSRWQRAVVKYQLPAVLNTIDDL
jgi:3-deoxy-D-manno-octulosonic acid kinase